MLFIICLLEKVISTNYNITCGIYRWLASFRIVSEEDFFIDSMRYSAPTWSRILISLSKMSCSPSTGSSYAGLISTVRRLHSRMCSRKPPKTHHTRNIMLEENPSGKYWVFVLINSGILASESVEKVCQNITMSYRNGERTISSVWDGTLKPFLGIRVRKNKDTIKESFLNAIQIIQWNQYM